MNRALYLLHGWCYFCLPLLKRPESGWAFSSRMLSHEHTLLVCCETTIKDNRRHRYFLFFCVFFKYMDMKHTVFHNFNIILNIIAICILCIYSYRLRNTEHVFQQNQSFSGFWMSSYAFFPSFSIFKILITLSALI